MDSKRLFLTKNPCDPMNGGEPEIIKTTSEEVTMLLLEKKLSFDEALRVLKRAQQCVANCTLSYDFSENE